MTKGTHVIQTYNHSANVILCVCGWVGDGGIEWMTHKQWGKENPFKAPKLPNMYNRQSIQLRRTLQLDREARIKNA